MKRHGYRHTHCGRLARSANKLLVIYQEQVRGTVEVPLILARERERDFFGPATEPDGLTATTTKKTDWLQT
jgi:hypothetical protein